MKGALIAVLMIVVYVSLGVSLEALGVESFELYMSVGYLIGAMHMLLNDVVG